MKNESYEYGNGYLYIILRHKKKISIQQNTTFNFNNKKKSAIQLQNVSSNIENICFTSVTPLFMILNQICFTVHLRRTTRTFRESRKKKTKEFQKKIMISFLCDFFFPSFHLMFAQFVVIFISFFFVAVVVWAGDKWENIPHAH